MKRILLALTISILTFCCSWLSDQDNASKGEKFLSKDRTKPTHSTTVWVPWDKIKKEGNPHGAKEVKTGDGSLQKGDDDCAGQFTQAICAINQPDYQNMLVVPNATSAQDALNRGRKCRSDISSCTFFTFCGVGLCTVHTLQRSGHRTEQAVALTEEVRWKLL